MSKIDDYSNIIVQELTRQDRKPTDVLLSWIVAWAYANKDQLLARQIIRQVKEQLVEDFQQAYNQCIEKLANNEFKNNVLRAFNIAIAKYRVREAIKNVSYDAPTEKVIEGLKEIATLLPRSSVLNRLIADIEEILKIKGGITTMPTPAGPPTPPTAQPTTTPPPTQPPQIEPKPTPPTAQPTTTPPPTQPPQIEPKPTPTITPPSIKLEDIKKVIEDALSKNTEALDDIRETVLDLSKRINKFEGEIENIKALVNTVDRHVKELKKSLKSRPSPMKHVEVGVQLTPQIVDTFRDVLGIIGLSIDEQKIKRYEIPRPHEVKETFVQKAQPEKRETIISPKAPPEAAPSPTQVIPKKPETPPPQLVEPEQMALPEPPSVTPKEPEAPPIIQQPLEKPVSIPTPTEALPEIPKPEEVLVTEQRVKEPSIVKDVFIVAIGDLRKLTGILSEHKDKSKPWRWNLTIVSGASKYNITIQGAAKRMPRRILREIQEKAEGILVIGLYDQGIVDSAVSLTRAISSIKFVVWCENIVPDMIKNLQISIESGVVAVKDDLIDILKRALFKAYEAG